MVDYRMALRCANLCREVYTPFDSGENPFSEFPNAKVTLIEGSDRGISEDQQQLMGKALEETRTGTQAALILDEAEGLLYVVFRGSNQPIDWINNFQFRQQIYPYGDGNQEVKFHRGFMAAYFAVRAEVLKACKAIEVRKIITTGHSLGGALAVIAALDIEYNITSQKTEDIAVYTYGAPRVGNEPMVDSFNRRVPDSSRFVYGWDIVTRVPRLWQGFTHVEKEFFLGSRWTWQIISRRFTDHAIQNYIDALGEKV